MPPLRERSTNSIVRQIPYEKPSRSGKGVAVNASEVANNDKLVSQLAASTGSPARDFRSSATLAQDCRRPSIDHAPDEEGIHRAHKWDCNQVRSKIIDLISSSEMKATHFRSAIGVHGSEYGRFMKMTGPTQGCNTPTYQAAYEFFLKREEPGIRKARPKKVATAIPDELNVDSIELEGECDGEVPVYDTCDDVRAKIRAHLCEPGVTQAGFCREIAKTYRKFQEAGKNIQSVQIKNFLAQSGARSGNMGAVYYAAYVYFEKLRIKNDAEKTEKRLDVEEAHPDGMDRMTNWTNQSYIISAGNTLCMDDLGFTFSMPEAYLIIDGD